MKANKKGSVSLTYAAVSYFFTLSIFTLQKDNIPEGDLRFTSGFVGKW